MNFKSKKIVTLIITLLAMIPLCMAISSNTNQVSAASFTVPKRFRGTWYNYAGTSSSIMKLQRNHEIQRIKKHSINGESSRLLFNTYRHGKAFSISEGVNYDHEHYHWYRMNGHDALVVTQDTMMGIYRRSRRLAKKYLVSDRKWIIRHKNFNPFTY